MTRLQEAVTGLDASRSLLEEMGFEHAQHLVAELMEQAVRTTHPTATFWKRF